MSLATGICAFAADGSNDGYGLPRTGNAAQSSAVPTPVLLTDTAIGNTQTVDITADSITPHSATLRWSSDVPYISYTLLKYNVLTGAYQEYLSAAQNELSLDGLREDTEYRFALVSSNKEFLGEVSFTTGIEKPEVTVEKVSSGYVTLRVTASAAATGTVLYRSTDGENFTELATLDGDTYTDTDVQQATAYYYKAQSTAVRNDKTTESLTSAPVKATTLKSFGLPAVSGATKTYAFYTAVTAKGSPQYKLLRSKDCYTDPATGIRMVDGRYCVALGSYYGTKIGTKYRITLEGGKEIEVILCDQKSDRHTDANHQYAVNNSDIVEFYIERSKLPRGIRGNYGTLPQFSGAVVAIEQYIED